MTHSTFRVAIVLLICCLCMGCPARWVYKVTNESNLTIQVSLGDDGMKSVSPGKTLGVLASPASGSELLKREVKIYSSFGEILHRANAAELFEAAAKNGAEYPNIYVIFTGKSLEAAENQRTRH